VSLQGACAAVFLGTTLYSAHALAARVFPAGERCVRWAAAAVVGIGTAIVVFEVLAALQLFRLAPALIVAVLGALATRWLTRVPVSDVVHMLGEDLAALGRFVLGDLVWLRPLRAVLALVAGSITARALFLPPLAHDTISYHGSHAAMWVQAGGDYPLRMPGGWSVYRYYPPGGEILGAWAMLPFHADTLYLLVDVALWLAWVPVLAALCAELAVPPKLRAATVLYVLTIPGIYFFLPGGYVDVTAHLLALCLLLFTLRALRGQDVTASAALALAAAMIAISVKIPALAWAAIVGALLLGGALLQRSRSRALLRGTAIGLCLGALVLAPMLLRNALELGAPLSPFPVRLLGITLGELLPEQRWYMDPGSERWGLGTELKQLATMFGLGDPFKPTFGAPSVLLVVILPFALFALRRHNPTAVLLLALLLASQLATYWSSGFALLRNHYGWCNARLFMLVPTIAALLAPAMLRSRTAIAACGVYLVLASVLSLTRYLSFFPSIAELLPLVAWGLLGLGLALCWPRIASRVSARALGVSVAVLVALALLLAIPALERGRASLRYTALLHSMVGHHFPVEWTEFARITDQPGRPQRIAIVSGPLKEGDRQLIYFFLGSKLQNELVYVSPLRDGTIPIFDRQQPDHAGADVETWVRAVLASGVHYVAVLNPPWIETRWLAKRGHIFELVAGNYASLLFRVRAPAQAANAASPPPAGDR